MLRSKKALGWRTLLVVPELDAELDVLSRCKVGKSGLDLLQGNVAQGSACLVGSAPHTP